jgi:prepilin-type N-terminal cleavage/methylation domain-containing protein
VNRKRGFTLLEMMVVVGIMSKLMGVLLAALMQTRSLYEATGNSARMQVQLRSAVVRIGNELRMAKIVGIGTNTISYQLPQEWVFDDCSIATSCASWDNTQLWEPDIITLVNDGGVLRRRVNGVNQDVYARDVSSLTFTLTPYSGEVRMSIVMSRRAVDNQVYTISETSTVNVRN